MNKEVAEYINSLLAERERLLEERKDDYLERHFHELQENDWELSIIYRCQKAMDYFEEEDN